MNLSTDLLGPRKLDIQSVGIALVGSFVSGALGGLFVLLCTVLFLNSAREAAPVVFPYVLSLVGLIAILISLFIHFSLQKMIFGETSSRTGSMLNHVFAFNLFGFMFLIPLYVYVGAKESGSLMLVFSLHMTLAIFGSVLITRVLTQYRYSILSIYSSLVGLIAVATAVSVVFTLSNNSEKILFSLGAIIAICLTVFSTATLLMEYCYYKLYSATGQDMLGDAMDDISREETENIARITKESTIFSE